MKKFVLLLSAVLAAVSCNKEDIEAVTIAPIKVIASVDVNVASKCDLTGYSISTLQGAFPIEGNNATVVGSFVAKNPQLIMLVDKDDNIKMLARDAFASGQSFVIDAKSTALSMVTLHPIFIPVSSEYYSSLKEYIESSEYFDSFLYEVEQSTQEQKNLFDPDNASLLKAYSTLMSDLCEEKLVEKEFFPFTKASGGMTNIAGINQGPFKVMLQGHVLRISNYALTPFYEGIVRFPNGREQEMDIPANDEYGITNFVTGRDFKYGDPVSFNFLGKPEGDYSFNFDRTTTEATFNFWCDLISNILDGLGLPLDKYASRSLAKEVWLFIGDDLAGSAISTDRGNLIEWAETIFWGITGFMGSDNFHIWAEANLDKKIASKLIGQTICRKLTIIYNFYTLLRGSVNSSLSLYYSFEQPKNVFFILNYSKNIVKAASFVNLTKIGGDDQKGFKGQRLLLPLKVRVDGQYKSSDELFDSQALCKVVFKVKSGGGSLSCQEGYVNSDGVCETYWTLGPDSGAENIVQAVAVDMATGEEISDYIEFYARTQSDAAITVTLDWDKTSTDTDIDLHIIDPYNHHIYFAQMNCSCGGYLDRDDVIGPGPEHITFNSAHPGTYQVYVHHYPNGKTNGCVVSYTVTAHVGDKEYKSIGSVSYDQRDYVGSFEIGDTRAVTVDFTKSDVCGNDCTDWNLPAKQ